MPSRGQTITITYAAIDTATNLGKTGDVGNHTLKWIKDGTAATPTNSASEVDSTNCPGVYKLTLTGTECTCDSGTLAGKSSTSGIAIIEKTVTFEQLPTAAAGAASGLVTLDGSAHLLAYSVNQGVTVTTNNDKTGYTVSTVSDKTGYTLSQSFPANFSSLAITGGGAVTAGTVSDKTGYTASTVTDKTGYALSASGVDLVTSNGVSLRGLINFMLMVHGATSGFVTTGACTVTGSVGTIASPGTPSLSIVIGSDRNVTSVSYTPPT